MSKSKNKSYSKKQMNIPWRVIIFVYAAILSLLNIIRIFDNNFWGDEAYSIRLAKLPVSEMLAETAMDVHPPLYYFFLMGAYRILGDDGGIVYHLVSVIPFLLVVIFSLTVVWKRFGKEAAFLLITFVGISSTAVTYNVEARMYSLAAMFVLFAFYGVYKMLKEEKWGSVIFVISSLGAAYSHYYAMISVAVFYLLFLILTIRKKFDYKKLALIYIVTIVGYVPWLLQMLTTFKRTSESFWLTSVPGFGEGLAYYFFSDINWYSWGMLLLTIGIVIYLIVQDNIKKGKVDFSLKSGEISLENRWMLWGVLAAIGTLVIGQVISVVIRPAFLTRYLYPVAVVMWIVLGVGVSKLKCKEILTVGVIAVTLLVYIPMYEECYQTDKYLAESCDATQQVMLGLIESDDIMLTNGTHFAWTIFDYYMPGTEYKQISSGFSEFDENRTYWLVWTNDLSETDYAWLDQAGYMAEEKMHEGILGSNWVHLYSLQKK